MSAMFLLPLLARAQGKLGVIRPADWWNYTLFAAYKMNTCLDPILMTHPDDSTLICSRVCLHL